MTSLQRISRQTCFFWTFQLVPCARFFKIPLTSLELTQFFWTVPTLVIIMTSSGRWRISPLVAIVGSRVSMTMVPWRYCRRNRTTSSSCTPRYAVQTTKLSLLLKRRLPTWSALVRLRLSVKLSFIELGNSKLLLSCSCKIVPIDQYKNIKDCHESIGKEWIHSIIYIRF